jgi:hypothetical protein
MREGHMKKKICTKMCFSSWAPHAPRQCFQPLESRVVVVALVESLCVFFFFFDCFWHCITFANPVVPVVAVSLMVERQSGRLFGHSVTITFS